MRKRIKELLQSTQEQEHVHVCGWIRSRRVSKSCIFIVLNDGSSQDSLQLVGDPELIGERVHDLTVGSAVRVDGQLRASPAKGQAWELEVREIEVLGKAPSNYPLQKKGHTLEFLRDICHLRARTNTFGAVYRVRNVLAKAVHDFFQGQGFVWAHTPILTASDGEGAGELFQVTTLDPTKDNKSYEEDFFGKKAYLAVTGQLEAEFLAMGMGDVYTFGPTFRAENSNTPRHLAEFWMIEPEMAFCQLPELLNVAEDFTRFVINRAVEECEDEIRFLGKFYKNTSVESLQKVVAEPFARVTYTEAMEILGKAEKKFEFPTQWGADLQTEHERYLCEEVYKKPVFVTDYPKDIKAFYMKANDDGKTVAAVDLLVPGVGELIGGSEREYREDVLASKMEQLGAHAQDLDWYMDLRRFGTAPHAGFGMGFERLVMFVTGMSNIRDVIMCPRTPNNIKF